MPSGARWLFVLTGCLGWCGWLVADPTTDVVAQLLPVQRAMAVARGHLDNGNAREAVAILEDHLARCDGNQRYLALLRDAYADYLRELRRSGDTTKAETIRTRLRLIDPSADPTPKTTTEPPETPISEPAKSSDLAPSARSVTAPTTPERAPPPPLDGTSPMAVARGRSDAASSDDPKRQGRDWLRQAEQAFGSKDYESAHRLFNQACECDKTLIASCGERLAYCKLHRVVASLNRVNGLDRSPSELEAEVEKAVQLAPACAALRELGVTVKQHIRDRCPTQTSPAALAATSDSWEVVESANFRVRHRNQGELASRLSKHLETLRTAAFTRWHGSVGDSWKPACEVWLHSTAQDYAQATGKPPASPGHATIQSREAVVIGRRIDVRLDDANWQESVLPHELTHVVLADLFAGLPLPRWADEGMAVLAEPKANRERYLRHLPECRKEGQTLSVAELMRSLDYPDPKTITAFYVHSVSLVEYLVSRADEKTFKLFLQEAPRRGYEECLRRYYRLDGFAGLQKAWEQHAFSEASMARTR